MTGDHTRRSPENGHRQPGWLAVLVPALMLVLVCAGLDAARPSAGAPPPAAPAVGKQLVPAALKDRAHTRRPRAPIDRRAAPPRWIRIPSIGVSAPVVALGLNPDRTLQVPRQWSQTGWYTGGPEPGERGPAVIAGHVDSTSGPAVFYRLGQLHRGAIVSILRADHTVARFRVQGAERWPKDRFPTHRVYRRTSDAALRLITCGGAFNSATGHYLDNTIVFATRIR